MGNLSFPQFYKNNETMITIKNSSKFVSIASSLLCIGAILSFWQGKPNVKPIALDLIIATGAIAVTSKLTEEMCEGTLKSQLQQYNEKHQNQLKTLTKDNELLIDKYAKQSKTLDDSLASLTKQKELAEGREELITNLQNQVSRIAKEYADKKTLLDEKLQTDDKRYEQAIYQIKVAFQQDLAYRTQITFERLSENIAVRLSKTEYSNIHNQLRNLRNLIESGYSKHCQWLNEIALLEGDSELIINRIAEIYFDISEECASFKVRHRNILNLDERTALQDALDELIERRDTKKYIPKPKVDLALDMYQKSQEEQLSKIKDNLDENKKSLNELYSDVNNLINEIDNRNIKIAELQQEIEELKKPQLFYGDSDVARNANKISLHYYKHYGYKLDAIDWTETPTGYEVIYGIRKNPALTEKELCVGNSKEQLAAFTNSLYGHLPSFTFNYQNCTLTLAVPLRSAPKKVATSEDLINDAMAVLHPTGDSLIKFIETNHHIGLWGETGTGKTTAISNIIGGMIQTSNTTNLKTTIPKIDDDSAKIFSSVDWLGVPNSIFGMLEAALEIQYRIHCNEQAFIDGREMEVFDPVIFFIDEINLIFTRWGKVNDADLDDVLDRFTQTLKGEKLDYFNRYMQIELRNYKNEFAKRLLLFIWQTGRSLKVKSLIAGQNLQPGALRLMTNDLQNCAYLVLGGSKAKGVEYKVKSSNLDAINSQINLIEKAQNHDDKLKFTALFCPIVGDSFLSILPPPNTYKWENQKHSPNRSKSDKESDTSQKNVRNCQITEPIQSNSFERFVRLLELPKKYQNLDYEGVVRLWQSLPKKSTGGVAKEMAYKEVFKVSRYPDRKLISEFIDYLEKICR